MLHQQMSTNLRRRNTRRAYRGIAESREPSAPAGGRGLDGCWLAGVRFRLEGSKAGQGQPVGVEMRYTAHGSESGQGLVAYVLILASVACLVTVVYLSGAINGLFGSTSNFLSSPRPRRNP